MHIFSVSEFIEYVNNIFVEQETIVEGEVSEFKVSQGKWVFFDLKDEHAKVGCFLTVFQLRGLPLEDGMKIRILGYPKIHPRSGRFSITVQHIELAGEGTLRRAFEMVKAKLEQDGLFATERKRPVPRFPRSIGLITSKESAAYSDFIKILNGRWGGVKIHLADVSVQGRDAVFSIVSAFDYFNQNYKDLDLEEVVLIRGGGSMEDLAAFNSEEVARAIFSSRVPVVCGVGHERDFTIADMVADVRVSTPTAAAQTVVPSRDEMGIVIANNIKVIDFYFNRSLKEASGDLALIYNRFYRFSENEIAKIKSLLQKMPLLGAKFEDKTSVCKHDVDDKISDIGRHIEYLVDSWKEKIEYKIKILESFDPDRVLARGYSMVFKGNKLVKNIENIRQDEEIKVKLYKGSFSAKVLNLDEK